MSVGENFCDHPFRREIKGEQPIQTCNAQRLAHVVAFCSGQVYLCPSGGGLVMKREQKRQAAWVHRGDLTQVDHNMRCSTELLVDALG